MAKRKEKVSMKKKRFTTKQTVIISLLFTTITVSAFLLYHFFFAVELKFSFKAAIVDQLGSTFESKSFVGNVTEILQRCDFKVVYNRSAEITVNFYRNLPKSNVGVILLRVHSAIRNNTNFVDFFTSENYPDGTYDEYGDALSIAWLPWELPNKKYYAIGPRFVEEFMDGTFPKSVVIAMGCDSLNGTSMAQAFINRGAKLYIGWTGSVALEDSDNATIKLLDLLFAQNETIKDAVKQCNRLWFQFPGHLDYFPKGVNVDNKTVWDLVLDADFHKSSLLKFGFPPFLCFVSFRIEAVPVKWFQMLFRNVWQWYCRDEA